MIEGSCVSTVRDQQMMSMIEEERGEMHSLLVNVHVWRRAQSLAYVSGCMCMCMCMCAAETSLQCPCGTYMAGVSAEMKSCA